MISDTAAIWNVAPSEPAASLRQSGHKVTAESERLARYYFRAASRRWRRAKIANWRSCSDMDPGYHPWLCERLPKIFIFSL